VSPLADMDVKQFSLPIAPSLRRTYLTARLAARRMLSNKSGVNHDGQRAPRADGASQMNGGYGPAQGGERKHSREDLVTRFARQGLRVVCSHVPLGSPSAPGAR